jgi:hypothetical protein
MHFVEGGEVDVVVGPVADVGDFLGMQRADDFGGGAHDERAGWNARALGDERVGADDAAFADDGFVEDGGAHADEAFVLDGAGVEDGAMADGDEFADDGGDVVGEVDDAAVLDVGAFANVDVVDIAAEDGGGPDAAAGGEPDVADDDSLGGDVGGRVDLRLNKEEAGAFGRIHEVMIGRRQFFVQFTLGFAVGCLYKVGMAIFTSVKKVALGVMFVALPGLAQANIGDTLPELRARYGSAKDMGGQMLFDVRMVDGQLVPGRGSTGAQDHFSVNVYFDGVNSAMEVFTRTASDPAKANMTQSDIDAILAAASEGQNWNEVETPTGRQTWLRSDRKLIARFSPNKSGKPDDASVLLIMLNAK